MVRTKVVGPKKLQAALAEDFAQSGVRTLRSVAQSTEDVEVIGRFLSSNIFIDIFLG